MKVLVFCEQRDGKLKSHSHEALTVAHRLAGKQAGDVAAVLAGSGVASLAGELKGWGAGKVYLAEASQLGHYNPLHYTSAMEQAVKQWQPQLVLGIASPMGRDLFARLSARLKAPLLTDLVEIKDDMSGGTKPMYAGKVLASVRYKNKGLRLATLRPNVFAATASQGDAQTEALSVSLADERLLKTLEVRKGKSEKPDLTEAARIVSGGRSLGSADNFAILNECAEVLGATVGASRAAVDSGYARHDMQVGQTGKTVNPNLYIACGISGSIQHMAGMRTSKVIVAVNTDPEAPIFSVATYGIVADLFEAVPLMTKKFKALLD
ncbi:MAG: electron transfer flavoprotein subunit alpha/FixB family protein [Deltaproteobacteria bacterium]|nr:electron transfer flavoprotein subunit alpha/FixB family protein [Deltaproteobacteria bacterium]